MVMMISIEYTIISYHTKDDDEDDDDIDDPMHS